jgi:hypothetical protein
MTKVVQLAPHNSLTPGEAVEFVSRMVDRGEIQDIIIAGSTIDGAEFRIGSKMTVERAIFMIERVKHNTMRDIDG